MSRNFSSPFRLRTGLVLLVLSGVLALALLPVSHRPAAPPIRIGVVHSLTGTMAISEQSLVTAAKLAIEEINAAGGLLGQPVEIIVADGKSDPAVFAAAAERLIVQDKVSVLFACWTSACRRAVLPVVEKHRHLMFYPVQYEGMEQSPHVLYTGAAPNQQIIPGAHWAMRQFGRRIYLLGSDYIFPRTANLIIRDLVHANDGAILGERYLPLGSTDFAAIVAEIRRQRPDVILNTLNGDSNRAFFDALVAAGLTDLPLLSFSVAEPGIRDWGGQRLRQHYGIWNYFQSTPGEANRRFVAAFKARLNPAACTSDPVEATYVGVHLWANTVRHVGTANPAMVNSAALLRQSFIGPSGIVAIDAGSRHLWKRVRIGKVGPDGQFSEVLASHGLIRPTPWPSYRTQEDWQARIGAPPP